MKTVERIVNGITGEVQDIERDMDAAELKSYQDTVKLNELIAIEKAENEIKRASAFSKLEALGLTAEDLRALGL